MRLLAFIIGLVLIIDAFGQTTYTTTQSGDFTRGTTWVGGSAPNKNISSSVTVIVNHNITMDDNIQVMGALTINPSGSFTGNKDLKIMNGGSMTADGLITAKKLDVQGNSTITINDSIYIDNDAKIEGDAQATFNGNAVFNKKLEIKDDATFTSNGSLLVEEDLNLKDDASVVINGTLRVNDDLQPKDNTNLTINGNAYIGDDFKSKNNANITIGSSSIVQVVDALDHDGGILTINGALVAQGNGNTNNSVNDGTIQGTGLLQVDGGGISNNGTVGGTLDICSADASSNPISGNSPSGTVTICTNSGINFPIIPAAPLPVELASFYGEINENTIDLVWITLTELNSDYFLIEHSNDGVLFNELTQIEAAGNSNSAFEYSFNHKNPTAGANYYRLVQFDKNGKFEEFSPILVNFEEHVNITNDDLTIYPNPNSGDRVFVKIPENDPDNISILINNVYQMDEVGDITFINQGDNGLLILEFEESLQPGFYIFNFLLGSEVITKKLIVK